MTLGQELRVVLGRLREFNNDPESIMADLEAIKSMALKGVQQEKIHPRDGIVTVTEVYPDIALKAVLGKMQAISLFTKLAEEQPQELNLVVNVVPLEERL